MSGRACAFADRVEEAAELLLEARLEVRTLPCLPEPLRPVNLREAYAIRDRLIERLGRPTGGWFSGATNADIQRLLGLREPYYAYLLADRIIGSPTTLDRRQFPPMVLECEFAFRLGADLPARAQPYGIEEVCSAVHRVHPAIEVVAGHLEDWPNQDVYSVIADNGTDGALVYGEGVTGWRDLNLVDTSVELQVNGDVRRRGNGVKVLGDPFQSLLWLVNALSRDGHGLTAGELLNTGTATDIYWVQPRDRVRAMFSELGEVEIAFN